MLVTVVLIELNLLLYSNLKVKCDFGDTSLTSHNITLISGKGSLQKYRPSTQITFYVILKWKISYVIMFN